MKENTWFDPFYLTDNLTEEELSIQKNIRDFCKKELLPYVIENNRNQKYSFHDHEISF